MSNNQQQQQPQQPQQQQQQQQPQQQQPTSNETQINVLKSEIDNILKSIILLDDETKNNKNNDIKDMIRYYSGMTNNIEDRRIRIANFSLQSLAVSITAFGLIISLPIISLIKIPLLIVLGTILVLSLGKILEYNMQSNSKYGFLKFPEYGNKWKWFYYGNSFLPKINDNPFTIDKSSYQDQILYLEGLKLFTDNYSTETIDKELQNNLLQLFLLQVHNFYKNRFYLRLLNYDLYTPRILALLLILYSIIVLILFFISPDIITCLLTKTF